MAIDDLHAFERRLGRSADATLGEPVDAELTEVLHHIARRRRDRRATSSSIAATVDTAHRRAAPVANEVTTTDGVPGEVLHVEDVTPSLRILRVGRPDGMTFTAGQYVKMGLAGLRRGSFSIASAPHEPFLEFCIERIAGGRLTPKLFEVSVGDHVDVADRAKGRLRLHPAAGHHLLVGTVTGIAPLRSLVRDALHRGLRSDITVLHGASHHDELPYRAELEALSAATARFEYVPTISRSEEGRNAAWTGATGRVDPLALSVAARLDASSTHVVATGNSSMVANVRSALGARGFAVSTESFD